MPTPVSPVRPLTMGPAPRVAPATPSVAPAPRLAPDASAMASYPGYSSYPADPRYYAQPEPSLWNGVTLVARGLGEILWVTAQATGTLLQWAGVAAVAILGVAWDVTKAVFNALARGFRAIFDPGYDPYRPWQYGEAPPPGSTWRY